MAKVCIICGKEAKAGHRVEDDFVILGIRKIKRALSVAKNNELVVMDECMGEYLKKRQKYERTLIMHVILGAFVFLIIALLPIFTSGFSFYAVVLGAALAAMIVGLAVLSHVPKVADDGVKGKPTHAKAAKKRKK